MDLSTIASTVANWLKAGWEKVVDVGSTLISAGLSAFPLPQPSAPPPSSNGSGGGSSSGGTPTTGGGFSDLFTQPVEFLRNITKESTWVRVGFVLLGILLIVVAIRWLIRANSSAGRVDRILREVGAK